MTPRSLSDRPSLQTQNRHLLEAFYELSAGRALGETPQPVDVRHILDYCELTGVARPDDRARLYLVVRKLDRVFLDYQFEQIKQERDLADAKAKSR